MTWAIELLWLNLRPTLNESYNRLPYILVDIQKDNINQANILFCEIANSMCNIVV